MRAVVAASAIAIALSVVPAIGMAASPVTEQGMEACLSESSVTERNSCYDALCDFSLACSRALVTTATEMKGPAVGTVVLRDLFSRGDRTVTGDGHDLQHQVGRAAARASGGSWEAFMECPDDFFLGCKHGFFESMLGELGSSVDAASSVCKKAPASERSFCFHGMGHGIMMANANDVFGSLKICDLLPGRMAKRGCYQGVFMENFNAADRGEARTGVLDPEDVLAPCTRVDDTYRLECFGQHAGYVLKALSGSLATAIQACERAGKPVWVDSCIRHYGQNMTTFDYHLRFLGTFDEALVPENTMTLCRTFPSEHQEMCLKGAAHNFMLYDHPEQAIHFCSLTGQSWCPKIIFPYLQRPLYTAQERETLCGLFPDRLDRFECRHPTMAPLLVELATILAGALVLSLLVLIFGWRWIRKR